MAIENDSVVTKPTQPRETISIALLAVLQKVHESPSIIPQPSPSPHPSNARPPTPANPYQGLLIIVKLLQK